MTVEVIVPWRPGCTDREHARNWLLKRLPYPVVRAPAPVDRSEGLDAWCKGAAVNPAVRASTADVVVVHDADVWTSGLTAAVDQVAASAAWAVPHRLVYRLDPPATSTVLAGTEPHPGLSLAQRPYHGLLGGGIVVATRELLLTVPIDERFRGWGQEDESHAMALCTLAGAPWRGRADLYHLWHPPQQRLNRRRGSIEGWQLRSRYRAARGNPVQMRALLQAASPCSPTS